LMWCASCYRDYYHERHLAVPWNGPDALFLGLSADSFRPRVDMWARLQREKDVFVADAAYNQREVVDIAGVKMHSMRDCLRLDFEHLAHLWR